MTVGVSYSFDGNVVVVDMEGGKRWDMTHQMARTGADAIERAAGYMTSSALVVIDCLDDRQFRWVGDRTDALKMASDLRVNADNEYTEPKPAKGG